MAGGIGLLKTAHRLFIHPGEVVVSLIIFLDVLEAEIVILAFGPAALGSPVAAMMRAARPLARRGMPVSLLMARLDTYAVEIFGLRVHRPEIMVAGDRCRKPRMGNGGKENVNDEQDKQGGAWSGRRRNSEQAGAGIP